MLTSEILKRAMRDIGALSQGQEPKPGESAEALDTLNTTLLSMFGQEIGLQLDPVTMTAATTAVPWAAYQVAFASAGATLTLPANPQDGWRVGWADVKANFATYNLTVAPNSRLISAASASIVYSTNSTNKRFFFRADTGNWSEETALALTDTPPFPVDFHGDLATILAVELYTQYWPGQQPDAMLIGKATASRQKFASRYNGRVVAQRARQTA